MQAIKASAVGEWMRSSLVGLPLIEAMHVMAVALLFGTTLIVDVQLLGLLSTRRSFRWTGSEPLNLTSLGFAVTLVVGTLLLAANSGHCCENAVVRRKTQTLALAGADMMAFELVTVRTSGDWNTGPVPRAGRVARALSIYLWITAFGFGRWVGFTKGSAFKVPADVQFDVDVSISLALPASVEAT